MRSRSPGKAFTLVELLVVISILAVLAAILFPVFARAKAAAGDASTLSNCRQLAAAVHIYAADHDDHYPQAADGTPGTEFEGGWMYYTKFGNVEAGSFLPKLGALFPYVKASGTFLSSGDKDARRSGNSFALNGFLTEWSGFGLNPGRAASGVELTSGTMLFGEEATGDPNASDTAYRNGTNDGYFNPPTDRFGNFHAAGSAVAFCDGHAKILKADHRFIETICGSAVRCFN